jgi:hypothetical protein
MMFKGNVLKQHPRLVRSLKNNFDVQDVMDALGLVYPQYWLKSTYEETFPIHLAILKGVYYQFKKLGSS